MQNPRPRWPHQEYANTETWRLIDSGTQSLCVTSPTGGGKSRMMEDAIVEARRRRWPVTLYTDRILLLDQISGFLKSIGIDHGYRASGREESHWKDVQLCMIQTESSRVLKREIREHHRSGLVIVDEAHKMKGSQAEELFGLHRADGARLCGFTATPVAISHIYEKLVVAGKNSDLRACGAHVPCITYAPDQPTTDLKPQKTGEFKDGDVIKAIMTPVIFGRVYSHWQALNPDARPTILFAPGVKESVWFADQFRQKGIRSAHIDGEDGVWVDGEVVGKGLDVRTQVLDDVRKGRIPIISNRFVLREGVDCLDAATEILTEKGWVGVHDIHPGDLLYTLNKNTEKLEIDSVSRVVEREVHENERMLTIKSQHVNIRVTENHNLICKFGEGKWARKKKISTISAHDFFYDGRPYEMPISGEVAVGQFEGVALSDDELRFIAWVLTDGHVSRKRGRVEIYQTKFYHNDIRGILSRLGLDFKERVRVVQSSYANTKPSHQFSIPMGTHRGKQKRNGWAKYEKYLTKDSLDLLMRMTRQQFDVFYAELMKGNGQTFGLRGNKAGGYWTRYKKHADQIMQLAVLRGYAAHCSEQITKKGLTMYVVRIRDKKWIGTRKNDKRSAVMRYAPAAPGEKVWCVTTGNGTIITRRGGCVAIMGNCPELYHGILATMFGSITSYLQSVGRLLRSHPSLTEVILQDHGGNYWRHGDPNADREWDMTKTALDYHRERIEQMRQDTVREPIACVECGLVREYGPECPSCGHRQEKWMRRVIEKDGHLSMRFGKMFRPIKVEKREDTEQLWRSMYHRMRNAKSGKKTFKNAYDFFRFENRYAPPKDLPFMPIDPVDWDRRIQDVPRDRLIQKKQEEVW